MDGENPFAVSAGIEEQRTLDQPCAAPLSRIFVAWLCFFLVATFGGLALGMVVGALIGAMWSATGASMQALVLVCRIVGFIVAIPVSFLCYWWSVHQFILKKMRSPL